MTSFHVDVAALESAAGSIATTIDSLHSDIARLTGQLRGLDGSWSGPAATAFATVVDEWTASSARVTESLGSIGSALGSIHAHYLDTEQSNLRMLGQ
jgi:WXG100 family type VII secretion target